MRNVDVDEVIGLRFYSDCDSILKFTKRNFSD